MNITPKQFSQALKALAKCLEDSSQADLESLLRGQAKLVLLQSDGKSTKPTKSVKVISDEGLISIADALASMKKREQGAQLLEESNLRRSDLETIMRHLGLPVRKDDNVERLKEKIVQHTIGARINSEAVRGSDR